MAKYLKFLLSDYRKASRDKREVSLVRELGVDVAVFGNGAQKGSYIYNGVEVAEEPTYKKSRLGALNHFVSFIQRIRMLQEYEFDVLSCHDITALAIGFLVSRHRHPKPVLVYDAHEFEIGRTASRNKAVVLFISKLERFLVKKCAFTIVVNDSIADEMTKTHRLDERPVVVRSTPNLWNYEGAEVASNRNQFCDELGVDPDEAFIIMYHGAVVPGRGIETVIRTVSQDSSLRAVIMGDGAESYLASLHSLSETSGAAPRVLFRPAVPREHLEAYVAAADVGMVTVEAVSRSYYYMLPNKFFENVQAEVPIVASAFPETTRLVRKYDIGELCDPSDVASVAAAISRIRSNPARRALIKSNLRRAKCELCWEEEKKVLAVAFRKVFEKIGTQKAT